ncbi:MAG: monovalent cation/H(+) antiporter subunit G [Candidatus Scalindua rubra]|uniref:Na(+)/H(+) antiporter subunit G n=1 Tax=Candidatus Scalindua brodae TaxID=237368 RepID=A0A0B0EMC1_9BACT|nr:MAG: Na(+)/H(+) antiporter subunit G [Candidatus Scalindua brodae]MBZ0108428.1 monovalent cation/H(+) antiporter subunit G [Candidatus Scalindua rubra]TWU31899.1 Na(+)/H(+) antiporter subunit G [Candidatus Brocadiaceae bacterium S225]
MDIRTIIAGVFLGIGGFFIIVTAIGIVRFPDFYSRLHPAGKADTIGQALVLIALMIYEGFSLISVKLMIIVIFIFIASPTATHAVAQAAYLKGVVPWKKKKKDKK